MQLFIGLMSGTSMDGIDAALVDVSNHRLIKGITRPYSSATYAYLRDVLEGKKNSLPMLSQLNTLLGREFAEAVHELLKQANISFKHVTAIGSHGQTLCHDATADIPYTLQLGCGHTIAALTGIPVVADFRTRDVVLGGQGAPFAPLYHQVLFGQFNNEKTNDATAVVNVGGIANVTFLAPNEPVQGYDTGPGNCLMDFWIQKHLNKPFDAGGEWANSGCVIESLLSTLLSDTYFKLSAPKSLDKAYFSPHWLEQHLSPDDLPQDVQATLLTLTATTISEAILSSHLTIKQVMICGGGVHNHLLLNAISTLLPLVDVMSTQSVGVSPDFLEAMMFAWLAQQRLNQTPLDLRSITGAMRPAVLGAIYAA